MTPVLTFPVSFVWMTCMALVFAGAALQVAVGAGLSVVCGFFILLWLGTAIGVPTLLCLNLLVSVVATVCGWTGVRWEDVTLASGATLVGCIVGSIIPSLPEGVLKSITACVLVAIALPRPRLSGVAPSAASARAGIGLAGLITGALTVWTATPGPITPVALARGGRSGSEIRRTMQPVSVVGYGAALAWIGGPPIGAFGTGVFTWPIVATLLGTNFGFLLRPINPARVVTLIRIVASVAASLLFASLFR